MGVYDLLKVLPTGTQPQLVNLAAVPGRGLLENLGGSRGKTAVGGRLKVFILVGKVTA